MERSNGTTFFPPGSTFAPHHIGAIPGVMSILAVTLSMLALGGWLFDVPALRSGLPGRVPMNPATAVALVMCAMSLSLWATLDEDVPAGSGAGGIATALGALAIGIGIAKLLTVAGGPDSGFDRRLFGGSLEDAGGGFINQMAPNTAACFIGSGAALVLLRVRRWAGVSQAMAVVVGFTALLVLLGYVYEIRPLYGIRSHIPMAANTALAFLALSMGTLFIRPRRGLASILSSHGPGGLLARWLIPAAVLVTFGIGWLRLAGQQAGLYGTVQGAAIMAVACSLAFVFGTLVVARSIDRLDARRRAAEARALKAGLFFQSIFENLPLMVFVKDGRDLRYLDMNPAGERFLGLPREEIIGRSDFELFSAEKAVLLEEEDRRVLEGGAPIDLPRRAFRSTDGEVRIIHTRKVPLPGAEGAESALLGITEDVTDRTRAEERAHQLNAELESFSYSVSHDLRAPLRAISGFSHALAEDQADRLDEEGRSLLARILAATARMSQSIDGLLILSRVTRTEIHRQRVDLSALAREVVEDLRRAEPDRRVDVSIQKGLTANGEPRLLRLVLQNLLGNAWKYTGPSAAPRIEFTARNGDGDETGFEIRDNGIGFDMEYSEKLFKPFQRLHGMAEFEGSGLGLATVQRIVRRHGGWIRGDGRVGEGAAFRFTLSEGSP